MSNWPLLSVLIWLPILGGALVLALGNARAGAARSHAARKKAREAPQNPPMRSERSAARRLRAAASSPPPA